MGSAVIIPVIASSGAGSSETFLNVFNHTKAEVAPEMGSFFYGALGALFFNSQSRYQEPTVSIYALLLVLQFLERQPQQQK